MAAPEKVKSPPPPATEGGNDQAQQQEALKARLIIGKDSTASAGFPFGGALIQIDKSFYEPSRLTISSFAIKPYTGPLIAGQLFQCVILLPDEEQPFEVSVGGAVKTLDDDFGLRVIFGSPQPYAQQRLASHLMAVRKYEEAAKAKAAKPKSCLLYTSPSPRDGLLSRMPSSA